VYVSICVCENLSCVCVFCGLFVCKNKYMCARTCAARVFVIMVFLCALFDFL